MKSNIVEIIEKEFQGKLDSNIEVLDNFLNEHKQNEIKINRFIDENCGQYSAFLYKLKDNLNEAQPIEKSKYELFQLFMNRCYNSLTNDFEMNFKSLKMIKSEFIFGLQNNYIHCLNNEIIEDKQIECIRSLNNKTIIYVNNRIIDYYDNLDKINRKIKKVEEKL